MVATVLASLYHQTVQAAYAGHTRLHHNIDQCLIVVQGA